MNIISCLVKPMRQVPSIEGLGITTILAVLMSGCGDGRPTAPTGPALPSDIDGIYTLRLESSCPSLPPELRSRAYTASIAGSPNLLVTLTGADFWTAPADGVLNRFTGRVAGNAISLSVFWPPDTERWGIVETVGVNQYLEILGRGSGSISGSTIEGRLSAGIGYGTDLRDDEKHVGCSATGHVLTFRFTRSASVLIPPRSLSARGLVSRLVATWEIETSLR